MALCLENAKTTRGCCENRRTMGANQIIRSANQAALRRHQNGQVVDEEGLKISKANLVNGNVHVQKRPKCSTKHRKQHIPKGNHKSRQKNNLFNKWKRPMPPPATVTPRCRRIPLCSTCVVAWLGGTSMHSVGCMCIAHDTCTM